MTQAEEYSVEQIETSYNLRGLRPDYETTLVPGWVERSESFRATHESARLDIAYGDGERDQLDLFPVADPNAPFLVYIHGGYWQRGDKSVYRFLARPFVDQGISVALINYDFCPNVCLSAIAPQVGRALAFLWRNAEELRINRDDYHLMGHSAGGHLTVEMMCTNWSDEASDLPQDFLKTATPLSGIYDLEPLVSCSENSGLKLDVEEAHAVSPLFRGPVTNAPQLVGYGALETVGMCRQSVDYHEKFSCAERPMSLYAVPNVDHFDILDVLGDPDSELVLQALTLIRQ